MKKILSIIISLGLLAVLYWKIDFARLLPIFAHCDPLWMTLSLGMVVPLTLFTAWRLQQLMPGAGGAPAAGQARLGFGEANRLILVASVLNMVLPSKGGDIAKAWFMRDRGTGLSGSLALSLVVFEKACDMLSLLLWCVFGLAIYPRKDGLFWTMTAGVTGLLILGLLLLGSIRFARFFFGLGARYAGKAGAKFERLGASWGEMHAYFWSSPARLAKIAFSSVFIWFLHLLQIWMFILALRAWAPFLANLAISPLAILAGLMPLTFAGVGTRDAALVLFYAPYFDAPTAAALGLLCTARYLLPALAGLPFAGQYLGAAGRARAAAGASAPAL